MNLNMQTVSNKSLSGIFLQCKLFSVIKYQIVNKFIIFLFNIYSSFL